jgi:glucokinase
MAAQKTVESGQRKLVESDTEIYLGVDIGGTKIAAGLVDSSGQILYKTRHSMNAKGTAEEGVLAVRTTINKVFEENPAAKVHGIGLSTPGPVDSYNGVVLNPVNLPCWRDFPLVSAIERDFPFPVQLSHDSKAAALAEAVWGAGAGYKYVFYATIGTGIGTAFIQNGQVHMGRTGAAGEGGHVIVDYRGEKCRCGKHGCIEVLAAGPAIAARARKKVSESAARSRALLALANGDASRITSEMVATAWKNGDPLSTEVLEETMDLLAIWFGNIVDLLEPNVIVVGGGVGALVASWFDHIREQLPAWCVNSRCREIPFVEARYGSDSGIVGAAVSCVPSIRTKS